MERVEKVWFDNERIWIETTDGCTLSRPLEAFPVLKLATAEQRNDYELVANGAFIHWAKLDEDIEIDSFHETQEPQPDNEIAKIFNAVPQLDVKSVADTMGVHFSLLYKYIYGMLMPSEKRKKQLQDALHSIGRKLVDVSVVSPAYTA